MMDKPASLAELTALLQKCEDVDAHINDYEGEPIKERQIQIKLNLAKRRLTLIGYDSEVVQERKETVNDRLLQVRTKLENMQEAVNMVQPHPQFQPHFFQANNASQQMPRKHVLVQRWGIQFGGDVTYCSLGAFLERIDDRSTRSYKGAPPAEALIWYRAARRRLNTWDELVNDLKQEF
jgi:hypothetical protein